MKEILPSEYNGWDPLPFLIDNEKVIIDYLEIKIEEKGVIKWPLTTSDVL